MEEAGPFADIDHELDENKLVLEDCYSSQTPLLFALLLYDAAHEVVHEHARTCTTRILATAVFRERLVFIFVHLEVWLLFESTASDRANTVYVSICRKRHRYSV